MTFSEQLLSEDLVTGVSTFGDHYPGDERQARIVVTAKIDRNPATMFIVDTGAPWCVANMNLFESPERLQTTTLNIRGRSISGFLTRADLQLIAHEGKNLTVEASFFVPDEDGSEELPNFLGLTLLQRIRFAVEPLKNQFCFGWADEP